MKRLRFLLFASALLALPSCTGLSGTVFLIDEDAGAKAGLTYQGGEGRAFARKDWRDPETGQLIARTQIEKRIHADK